ILSDDNFATIVRAIEQGRKLYDNLNKYVRFVLITLVAFVLTFLGATLLNIAAGEPFTSGQALWIHFFVSAPFGVALGLDAQAPAVIAPPGLRALATYRPAWLRDDVVAGLVLSTLLVPQGMAYAELAGLPAITGLYTSVLCLLGYAVFGPSRVLVLGPDSSLGPMIAATILPLMLAEGDPARAVALASLLAVLVGAIMVGAGF